MGQCVLARYTGTVCITHSILLWEITWKQLLWDHFLTDTFQKIADSASNTKGLICVSHLYLFLFFFSFFLYFKFVTFFWSSLSFKSIVYFHSVLFTYSFHSFLLKLVLFSYFSFYICLFRFYSFILLSTYISNVNLCLWVSLSFLQQLSL